MERPRPVRGISFLAAAGSAQVTAVTAQGRDSANEDLERALRAARHLPQVEHIVLPSSELPLTYAGLWDGPTWLNEPSPLIVGRRRVGALARLASARGPRVHLTGHGGDHVFGGPSSLSLPEPGAYVYGYRHNDRRPRLVRRVNCPEADPEGRVYQISAQTGRLGISNMA
ncbi:asparagine synthase-related protein [Nocardia carnea]|uniref:asparagine synthase-related protein n=1 Tax=Nocardia carnea TaxID=37328 RepID=UPI003D76C681